VVVLVDVDLPFILVSIKIVVARCERKSFFLSGGKVSPKLKKKTFFTCFFPISADFPCFGQKIASFRFGDLHNRLFLVQIACK